MPHNSLILPHHGTMASLLLKSRQAFILLALTVQNTAFILFTKFSYRPSAAPYLVSTVLASAELSKLGFSCFLLSLQGGRRAVGEAVVDIPKNTAPLLFPAALYVAQNNLLFYGIRLLSPHVYIVCSQLKILTSAFFSAILLKTQVTRGQSVALFLLLCGMILVQVAEGDHSSGDGHVTRHANVRETLKGVTAVFAAALMSGFSGAYLEKMYKGLGQPKQSLWFRNAQLSSFSLLLAIASVFWCDGETVRTTGLFQGYDGVVITVVILHALGGLVVAAVLRYASNLLKCFAVSISICNCAVATTLLPNQSHSINGQALLGIFLVIFATLMYSKGSLKS